MNVFRFRSTPIAMTARHVRHVVSACAAGALLALPGCAFYDRTNAPLTARPEVSAEAMIAANSPNAQPAYRPAANGSIFQPAAYRPLLEDHRARMVGDVLTITIVEKLSATQSATSTIDKAGKLSAGVSGVPFVSPSFLTKLDASGSTGANSSGKGQTVNTNDFTGSITATVVGVLPNGHLLVRGEKQIGVNQNVDTLQFTGQVDPSTIVPGNSVPSALVANVRIQQSGRGAQADAQQMGWLSRFFLNISPV